MSSDTRENISSRKAQLDLYESIINFSDDAILSRTMDGIITSWNKGAEKLFGHSADEAVGQNISILIPPHLSREELEIIAKIKQGEHIKHYETKRLRKDGSIIEVSLTISPIKDKDGTVTGVSKIAQETEKKYYHLFRNNPTPTWVIDAATFQFQDVNKAAITHYGYSYDEFLSMTAIDIKPDDEKERFLKMDREEDHSGFRGLWRHKKKDGTIIYVEINLDNIIFNDRKCYLIIVNDVTEKTAAENKLKHITQRLKQAQSIAHIGSWAYDFSTGNVSLSDEACRIFGLSTNEDDLSSATFLSFVYPDDLDLVVKNINRSQVLNTSVSFHCRIVRKDGTIRHLFSQSEIERNGEGIAAGQYGVVHDITEQKNAEAQNLQAQQRYQTVVENILDGLMIDDPNGKVIYANDQFLNLFGLERDDLDGLVLENYVAPEYRPILRDRHNRRVAGEDVPALFEYQGLQKNGNRIWLEVRVCKVVENGAVIGTQSAIRDITDRKHAESEVIRLYQSLEQKVQDRTAQLEALNNELESFSYSVAHDLRAPLRIISGYSEILKNDYQKRLDGEADRLINVIVNNTHRMGKLIDEILNLARLGRKELVKTNTDMNEIVRQIINEQTVFSDGTVKFNITQLSPAICDGSLICQVWSNLISNAVKYSGKKPDPQVEINSFTKGNSIVYSIKDNGVGFEMKYEDKLFMVFQRLHKQSEFEGTGVGLALVQRIIAKHGGTVWADAEPDKGATFYFSLPIN